MDASDVKRTVHAVIDDVRARGDDAVLEFTERWDRVRLTRDTMRVPADVLRARVDETPFVAAFRRASERVERFHVRTRPQTTLYQDPEGAWLGLRWTSLRSVGLYVPGGRASYPSTLAMTAIPARVAGVERIVVVSPPGPDGEVSPEVLLAARVLGIEEVYRVGGAQAIAALALGTPTIPRVDKIFGPGNAYVAEAKAQLFGEVGIDLVAGPSEVVVWADESSEPDWIAADLIAQAEHDIDTRVTLIASTQALLDAVRGAVTRLVEREPRAAIIRDSLSRNGSFVVASTELEAARRIDEIAPEHLSIQTGDPWAFLPLVRNAGAIFLGKQSPVAVGDYYAGPNHVLPTGRTARFASCLGVEDFMKRSNLCSLPADFVAKFGRDVEELAAGEHLSAHATSVRLRREKSRVLRPRPGVRGVTPYVLVEENAEVKLNQNEFPLDVPSELKAEVARRLVDVPWNRYAQKLPDEFLEILARDAGVGPDHVVAGTGSNLVLQWIFEVWGGPGRAVLYGTPGFALYPLWARVTETRAIEVPLGPRFEFNVDAIIAAIHAEAPEIVVLCLPNNPTGNELDTASVRRIATAAASHGSLVVIDEAYREFSDPEFDRTALVDECANVLLLRTCSKAFAAAGMRLGYLIARDRSGNTQGRAAVPYQRLPRGLRSAPMGAQGDLRGTDSRALPRKGSARRGTRRDSRSRSFSNQGELLPDPRSGRAPGV
jgi:histidinol dehydrogenase